MTSSKICVSWLDIKLSNIAFEESFQAILFEKNSKFNPFISLINGLILISLVILENYIRKPLKDEMQGCVIFSTLMAESPILLIIITLQVAFRKNPLAQKISMILNYLIFSVSFLILRKLLGTYSSIDLALFYSILYLDFLIKSIWVFCELIDFYDFLIINLIMIIILKVVGTLMGNWWEKDLLCVLLSDLYILFNVAGNYCIMKHARYLLHYATETKKQSEWYKNILDNMNSGFIKVINQSIVFGNKLIYSIAMSRGLVLEEATEEYNCSLHKFSQEILTDIILHTDITKEDNNQMTDEIEITGLNYQNLISRSFELIKNIIIRDQKNKLFVYIGRGRIPAESLESDLDYELFGRNYTCQEGEIFEFIVNDITRTIIIEEKNNEIKLKSVLLSKIAHEFKNPLICLNEIIEEHLPTCKCPNRDKISIIKAITNYLLILVKDIDYFLNTQIKSKKEFINNTLTNLSIKTIIDFITMIAKYLLKSMQLENLVTFTINCDSDIPSSIETDEIKLKQLLINLLSNSIKFTNNGMICLDIKKDNESFVTFTLTDTGIGMTDQLKTMISEHLYVDNDNGINQLYSIGFGLATAIELSSQLGKQITFESQEGKGSSFTFSILTNHNGKHDQEISANTVLCQDIILSVPISSNLPVNINHNERKMSLFSKYDLKKLQIIENKRCCNLILADDEELIRKASSRVILRYAQEHKFKINILDASDGIDILWLIYNWNKQHHETNSIDIIISDENMQVYCGQRTAKKLKKIKGKFNLSHTKFFISSAYTTKEVINGNFIDGFFHKPLIREDLDIIFKDFCVE